MSAPSAAKATTKAVSSRDYYRYRRFEGVNLGSWFVNERWICESVFANAAAPGQSDLDICKGSNAQKIFENHWDNWMTTSDWQFIVNQGMNTVRLPIGYYHLSQGSIIADTDFAPYGHVFSGAWDRIMKAINTAASYGLGVLVDLHAAPGGQNTQPHSGTSSGQAKLWGNATNQARCLSALVFLVQKLSNIDNVIGLELLNEPSNGNYLAGWYIDTIKELRKYSSDFPIYIHDGFDPAYYAKFVGSHTDLGYVVQDTHFYRCFSASDTAKSSDTIIQQVITDTTGFWASMASWSKGRLIVGEWSAALADSSLKQSTRIFDSSRGYFAYVQLAMFKADVATGWMFWTVKKESGKDTAWSLEDARKANTVPSDFSRFLVLPKGTAPQQPISAPTQVVDKAAALQSASDTFKANIVNITQVYGRSIDLSGSGLSQADIPEAQLQLFKEGFNLGFDDAVQFSTGTGANQSVHRPCKIGHIDRWSDIRTENFLDSAVPALGDSVPWQRLLNFLKSSGTLDAPSVKVWEYKEGVIAGIAALDSGMPDSFHLWADEVKKA